MICVTLRVIPCVCVLTPVAPLLCAVHPIDSRTSSPGYSTSEPPPRRPSRAARRGGLRTLRCVSRVHARYTLYSVYLFRLSSPAVMIYLSNWLIALTVCVLMSCSVSVFGVLHRTAWKINWWSGFTASSVKELYPSGNCSFVYFVIVKDKALLNKSILFCFAVWWIVCHTFALSEISL
jgi:hypothetical protein